MMIELNIGNYYGNLTIKSESGKFYWQMPDWKDVPFIEIPEYLYNALYKYSEQDL